MKILNYRLDNLDCANCADKIERKLQKLEGVKEASVNFTMKQLYMEYECEDDTAFHERVKHLITDMEPDVICVDLSITQQKENHPHSQHHHDHEEHDHCDCGEHHHDHEEHDHCGCDHEHHHEERQIKGDARYVLQGLDCANCAEKVERGIAKLPGIKDAAVNFSAGTLQVVFEHGKQESELYECICEEVKRLEPDVVIYKEGSDDIKEANNSHKGEIIRLAIALLLYVISMFLKDEAYAPYLFGITFIISGGPVVLRALRNIMRGDMFDENFLMSIATIGAFAIGDYGEGVAVMIFYEIGELFQSYAVNRSRKSIKSLMDIRADKATLLVDGKERIVDPATVKVGDTIVLKAGERVPLDGILLSDSTSLDTSALSGEAMPRDISKGDEVLAGSINISKVVQVEVSKPLSESTVSRILEMVQNAGNRKAPVEKFITKFARIYTPAVVLAAIALVIIPTVLGYGEFETWLYRGLTFLVVSCPCALVVSIPLGLFAGIGGASAQGILIKGGNYLEALKDIDTVVFDKTGTLTKGIFKVLEIKSERDDLLEIAAYGERFSSHPIARSIVDEYGKTIDTSRLENYEEVGGRGIKVDFDRQRLLLGNALWLHENNITFEEEAKAGTIVYIASNDEYIGYIRIGDEIKATSAQAIKALKEAGVKRIVMLTGDQKLAGEAVKEELGLDEVYTQLLPGDKVAKVEELLKGEANGKNLAFVGDGINDAPVIARADIGYAMGGIGSDAAIEAADVVLMKDNPLAIASSIRISKKTKALLYQNVIFSLGIKAAVLVLSAFGLANMWWGVFADVGVTLLAVLNSMRALRFK